MRCPKCHYLSFDPEPRCKNCGYDLEVADTDLALRTVTAFDATAPDLELRPHRAPAGTAVLELEEPNRETPAEREPALTAVADHGPARPHRVVARAAHTTAELPLFVKDMSQLPPAPRPPLAVRRAVPEVARASRRPERRVGPLDHDLLDDLRRVELEEAAHDRAQHAVTTQASSAQATGNAPAAARIGAAIVDAGLLGAIGTFVLWGTLRLSDAGLSALGIDALIPLIVFLAVVSIGYLFLFTVAGGQTVGKMLTGIRVVDDADSPESALTLAQATLRAVLAPVSVLTLGLAWLPALFGRGLALHDRLSHTRVVRA